MGEVYPGIHEKIALGAKEYFGLTNFVETGTYEGKTTLWAMKEFDRVVTIEISKNLFHVSEVAINNAHNVLMILGDSREWLASVCRGRENNPTLFWLDSHWTGEMETPDPKGCPVLEEIDIINKNFFGTHVIMVDDYSTLKRLNWADSDEIIRRLENKGWQNRHVRIMDDIYFAAQRIPEEFETWRR